jgi:hypothetical protein
MSREDYIIDTLTSTVTCKGEAVASYNSVTGAIIEYLGSGSRKAKWIKEALKNSEDVTVEDIPAKEITEEMLDSIQGWRLDFYEVFPDAPRPVDNKVGHVHPDIAEWIAAKYPKFYDSLFPFGPWDSEKAGMGRNQTHPNRGVAHSIEIHG